ncbi:MAG: hypothetical protein CISAcid_14360 [uncultured Acidilobus sp. CIS]|nr:MAG: hypothetical protein CISAcid_14360 [uncultured Acidilobus sp. CIS]
MSPVMRPIQPPALIMAVLPARKPAARTQKVIVSRARTLVSTLAFRALAPTV